MDGIDFEEEVRRVLDSLPDEIAAMVGNIVVIVEDEKAGHPSLLGLYEGVPLTERHGEPLMPDRITIYRSPLERTSRTASELQENIRVTVLHEIGHHFGMDEAQLDELGYA